MMEPFSLASSQFIMNSTSQQAVRGVTVTTWEKSSLGSTELHNEQELQPLRPCNRQNNGGECEGKENGTCLSMSNNAGDSERKGDASDMCERTGEEVPDDELTGFTWNEKDSVSYI